MAVWFVSDTHFQHYAIIELCKRPISNSLNREEKLAAMNKLLIDNWNSVVKPEDEVYHLGDYAFAGTTKCTEIFEQLKGRKYLVRGNHDGKSQCKQGWEWVKDYYVLRKELEYESDEGETLKYTQPIVMCHFPILSWDGMSHGAWHLHGHCHGSLKDTGVMRLDMGVDCNNWFPVSLDEVRQRMLKRSIIPVDHHIP